MTDWKNISAGVSEDSVLGPLLYLLYTADIPTTNYSMTAMLADDTAIMATDEDEQIATDQLQRHLTNPPIGPSVGKSKLTETNRYT